MDRHWHIQPQDSARIQTLERLSGIPSVVAQLLVARGVHDADAAKIFLDPKLGELRDPESLPGVSQAAELIHAAVKANRRIIIYGDYDADGMTSTAILYRCLELVSANVGYYIPNRMDEGYGLNCEAIEKLAHTGASMIISVDCGITSIKEAEKAKELGVDLIISDHHELADQLPPAAAIVHPRLPGHSYPFDGLCGAGVAFKLAWAICQRASNAKKVSPRLRNYLLSAIGLAAIGTIADVVPLVDENRIIVKHGLKSLRAHPVPGLECLMKLTGISNKRELGGEDVGFVIGPRLNAAGRLGQAQLGVELLTTESPDRAKSLAEYIHELNNSRASLERSIYLAANKQVKEQFDPDSEPALVLSGRGWHKGVIGIVAGRLAEKYHRPVVMIALDELGSTPGTGSARSVAGVNLHEALYACTEYLVTFGGHAAAAGLRIDEPHIDRFRAHFCDQIAERFSEEKRVAELLIDTEAPLSAMTLRTVTQIESLSPFGEANPRPLFCATGVELAEAPKTMGKGDRHITLSVQQNGVTFRGIAFNKAEWLDDLCQANQPIDLAYRPIINEFRGRRNVELHIADWRKTASVPI